MGMDGNFDDPESRQPLMLKTTLPFLIISYLAVLARIYARRYMKTSLAADDYMILVALVSRVAWRPSQVTRLGQCADIKGLHHWSIYKCSAS